MPVSTPKLVSDLLTDVKLAMHWDADPDGNAPYSDAEIVRVAQQVLEEDLYPALASMKESYLTAQIDIPLLSPAGYDSDPTYTVPSESMSKIVSVGFVHNGREYPLERYEEAEYAGHMRLRRGYPQGYALRGGRVVMLPHPLDVSTKYLRVRYVAKPLKMSADATVVYRRLVLDPQIVTTSLEFSLDSAAPATWVSSPTILVDLIALSATAPHVPVEYMDSLGKAGSAGGSLILANLASVWPNSAGGIPSPARKDDFLIADFQTPIVQLPVEAYKLLRRGVVAEFADARGDREKHERNSRAFEAGLEALPAKLWPRNEEPQTYVNWNSPGRVRRRGYR